MSQSERSEFNAASTGAAIAAGVGSFISIAPIIASTFSIFLAAFVGQYHWGRGETSLAITLCALVGGAVTPFAGKLIDRYGVRRVMLPAIAAFGLAVLSVSLADGKLWQLYVFYCLIGVTAGFQNMVAYSKVVSVWFHGRRGLVLSLVTACYGLSGFLMQKVLGPLVATKGWQAGYVFLGCVVLVGLVVIAPLLKLPAGVNLQNARATSSLLPGVTAPEAHRTVTFWLLSIVLFLAVLSIIGTTAHVVPMLRDRGIPPITGANVGAMIFLGSMIGQLSYGVLVDRFNTPRVALPFFIASLIGTTILHRSGDLQWLYAGAILMGIGQGAELGLAAYFVGRYFGLKQMGAIYGGIYACATVASGLGPYVMGKVFDMAGSYRPVMMAFEAALALAVIGIAALRPYVFEVKRSDMRK